MRIRAHDRVTAKRNGRAGTPFPRKIAAIPGATIRRAPSVGRLAYRFVSVRRHPCGGRWCTNFRVSRKKPHVGRQSAPCRDPSRRAEPLGGRRAANSRHRVRSATTRPWPRTWQLFARSAGNRDVASLRRASTPTRSIRHPCRHVIMRSSGARGPSLAPRLHLRFRLWRNVYSVVSTTETRCPSLDVCLSRRRAGQPWPCGHPFHRSIAIRSRA
ncbi:MAG: hypothetical protein QOF78_42 [Phycisphaerales bacterium]|jgi:hypothetical protein|nr:hypothetical protein [Phycisphaerales bacterium]